MIAHLIAFTVGFVPVFWLMLQHCDKGSNAFVLRATAWRCGLQRQHDLDILAIYHRHTHHRSEGETCERRPSNIIIEILP